jgi:hypothetical protein
MPHIRTFADMMLMRKDIDFNKHGADQLFLNGVFWKQLKHSTMIHQRRKDIRYPEARTMKVAPQVAEADKVVRHIGAGYDVQKAMDVLEQYYDHSKIELCETMEWPNREHGPDVTGRPDEPWYTREAITFLEGYLKPWMRVLEFGGGASTVWYSKRVATVCYVEHDPLWHAIIESKVTTIKPIYAPYDKWPEETPSDMPFDLLAVDGLDRLKVIGEYKGRVKPGGYILLDNSDAPGMEEADDILKGWEKMVTKGAWETTLWRKPE